jgi:hypothetical protein
MGKRISLITPLIVVFLLASLSGGFDNNANFKNPDKREEGQREYTHENSTKPVGQGGYYGGHDTLTSEGMLLKKEVHKNDADGGTKFNTFASESIPNLRTGAHDEDSTKKCGVSVPPWKPDPPIGTNGWGDFFDHFYNPETEEGIRLGQPATKRAMDYLKEIMKKTGCSPAAIGKLSEEDKRKVYDYFGRIEHLIEDMGMPSHTKNDIHLTEEPFEKYVNDHWDDILNSDAFKEKVTVDSYLNGNYGLNNSIDPTEYMKALARKSSGQDYYSQGQLYDWVWDSTTQDLSPVVNQERLMKNVKDLVPETIKFAAGFMDAIYQYMSATDPGGVDPRILEICKRPPDPPSPSNDHPDDRFDVSDEFYWEKEFGLTVADLTELYLRTAVKKGKIGVWYGKRSREIFIDGRTTYKDAPQETKKALEAEFQAVKRKLEQRGGQVDSDWKGAPDVALFANGFYNPSISLMLKIGEPVSFQRIDFDPAIVTDHPVMLVPTGGFYGLKNSATVKALLDEYVKNGGTLVLFTQQHGYDWDLVPVPINPETGERKPVMGYGYQEDQSCQFNSVYIDTYHPILSVFSTSTANIGVDGYFSSYPDNSTILLRRVANGQPATIMYPYGNGYVIATTMYTDFAFTHSQTNQTEIDFIQNIIAWAKKPGDIVEIRPGNAVNLNINVSNFVDTGAASIKFTILNPSRKAISEQAQSIAVPAGQSVIIPFAYTTTQTSALGIYHTDYTLFDSSGNIIQPQAETDSGRFVVSNPPANPYKSPDFGFSVQSDAEYYVYGSPATFTFILWNHTDTERQIKVEGNLSHHRKWIIKTVAIPPRGSTQFSYILDQVIDLDRCFTWFYDESGKQIGLESKGIWVVTPSAYGTVSTDKPFYMKGETVTINTSIKNYINFSWQPALKIEVRDSKGIVVFEDLKRVIIPPSGTGSFSTNFTLPQTSAIGSYYVKAYSPGIYWYSWWAMRTFELPESQISISLSSPSVFDIGTNIIPFTIKNTGKINVSSGIIDLNLQDPKRNIVYSGSQPFIIAVGESRTLSIPISISSVKMGNYTLTYSQSDETKTGGPTTITIPNNPVLILSFDKPFYRIRETANLTVNPTDIGKFNVENVSVTVSAADVNFTESQAISLGVGSSPSLNFAIPIPETVSAGLHNVSVAMILPGGDSVNKNAAIYVPTSSLSVRYQGAVALSAGDTLEMIIENSGGVDTNYDAYIYFWDQGYWFFDSKSATGSIQTGAQSLLSYTVPDQLTTGGYTLRVEVIDRKVNKITSQNTLLSIAGLSGGLAVKTDKDIYLSTEETTTLSTIVSQGKPMADGNLHLEIACTEYIEAPQPVSFHIYTGGVEEVVLHFPGSYEQQELPLSITPDHWGNTYIRIEHEGAQSAYLDYLALRDSNGNIYSPSFVGIAEVTDITSEAQGIDGVAAWVTGQTFYASWGNLPSGVSYTLVMVAKEGCGIVWQSDTAINQGSGVTDTLNISAGNIGWAGKYYLRGTLSNSLGQSLGTSYYPFSIIDGDTVLLFNTDKRIYRSGETVTITGRIENQAPITAENLTLTLNSARGGQSPQLLLTETINLLSGGNYPFTITTTAGEEGVVTLSGVVKQNSQPLVRIGDQYEVALPYVSTYVDTPALAGNESFPIEVDIWNDGKVDATVQFGVQSSDFGDSRTITIPPGEMKILQYSQQISKNESYTFTFTGDYQETTTRTVPYGLGASIEIRDGSSSLGVFSERSVAVPVTLTNTGQSTVTLEVSYQLNPGATQQSKTYSLPVGGSATDTLYFDLTEGDYQITVTSQRPDATAQANFLVRKENQVEMTVSLGAQTNGLNPVNVNLANVGFNEINGSVSLSVTTGSGQTVWNRVEPLSQLSPQSSQLITLNINPSAIEPGNYTLQVQLLNNSNQLIATQSLEFAVRSVNFQITQLPPYQIFMPGQEATFLFRVKNTGDQEGAFDLRFKAYDLIDSTQKEWLNPGEEKPISFSFLLPGDLEEKDYFAEYELKGLAVAGVPKGQVKYRLAGINLNVNATLDKPYYTEGETAHLTINIQTSSSNPQDLFARVNYAGYEPQQTFTLNGNQVLIFDVPLPKITGEKLFYGIYHEGGRSIHLNSLYIHKAGDVITITTDKQAYQPRDIVSVSMFGNASGNMTLSGPGGYTETFIFTGSATRSFPLPPTVAAGTYFINAQLSTLNSELVTAVHPFDVAGIQVKVLECNNDKGKYASSDTIATTFTISSNTTVPAILKAWIVDPTGQYTSVGENSINLNSSENSLVTYHSPLITSVAGIHRLVYGIYGLENLLLCSGSEAFDVGEAVLLGLSTDKRDYPTNTEPVIVTASLFGSVNAELQFDLDGTVIKTETISLNGFTPYTTQLQNVSPGPHNLKATLTAGGLKSTKENSFTYALSYMPKPQISASPTYLDFGSVSLGNTSAQTLTLSSRGNADLVIGTIALSGTKQGEFNIQSDNCSGRTITPSGNCALDILFSATSLGAKSASLSIPSNATDTPTLNLPLGGAGATTLNLSINPSRSGRVTGAGIDCPGDCTESFSTSGATIQLTASLAEGYRFVNWTGDINSPENPVTVNMDTHKNVTANFAINTYTITATASLGGSISPSGSVTVNYGGSQTFTTASNPGYHIVDVRVDGVSIGAVTTYTFSNVTSDHTLEVIFAINQYTITATTGSNGAISPLGTSTVNYGGRQTFTLTPNEGYHIADVKVDGISVGVVTTFAFNNVTSNHTIEVTFEINNSPPVADAGLDQNVIIGQVGTLNGSKSYDPEGAMITFLWTFVEVPAGSSVTNASLSDVTSAKPQFTPDVNGAYRLQLIVNDGALNSIADEVVINATTPNVAPNANAGPDQNVFRGNTVQLDGSRSSDPDNGPLPLSYLWSFTAKPAWTLLTDNHIADRNMPNSSFIPDVDGLYELTLTVNDGNLSSEDKVQIMATTPNVPPNANAGADMTVNLGDTAVLDGSASNDPDHGPQPLTYLWSFVAVPTGSQLTNGAIIGANTVSPSFTPDVVGTYVLQLMVFDGIDAGFDNVAVTVGTKQLATLSPVKVWLGLKNSDDQGTYFDLRVDLLKNGVTIATGETRDIRGITRNPSLAKEVTVAFGSISDNQLNSGDVFSLRIMTKVTATGGHSNAVGLRLYYDALSRPSRFGIEIAPGPMKDYFLHSDSSGDFLNSMSPTATDAKYKDSASVNRATYKEIGTWRFRVQ